MTIWNTRQGHNDRVRVGPAETNLEESCDKTRINSTCINMYLN